MLCQIGYYKMNLKQAELQNKLAGLRKKWLKATKLQRIVIELHAKKLNRDLDKIGDIERCS